MNLLEKKLREVESLDLSLSVMSQKKQATEPADDTTPVRSDADQSYATDAPHSFLSKALSLQIRG